MSWSCCGSVMVAYGCQGLLLLMQTETEEGTMPTQVNKKARLHTRLVCRNRGPRWHDLWAQCFGIGGAKYVSFLCIWACAKWVGVAKPRIVRGAFLFFACIGAANDTMQSWQRMRVMARLCKRARLKFGGAGGEMFFCWSVMPQLEGVHTRQPLMCVELASSLSLPSFLTPLLYIPSFFSLFFSLFFSFFPFIFTHSFLSLFPFFF